MTPRQRKLLLLIAARQAEGRPTLVEDLCRMGGFADMTVLRELYEMRGMDLVSLEMKSKGSMKFNEIGLTLKGASLIPRVKELA